MLLSARSGQVRRFSSWVLLSPRPTIYSADEFFSDSVPCILRETGGLGSREGCLSLEHPRLTRGGHAFLMPAFSRPGVVRTQHHGHDGSQALIQRQLIWILTWRNPSVMHTHIKVRQRGEVVPLEHPYVGDEKSWVPEIKRLWPGQFGAVPLLLPIMMQNVRL